MEKFLDDIKFEEDGLSSWEAFHVYGIEQIKTVTKVIVNLKINDDYEDCCTMIDVLEEKVFEVDECFKRLVDEMYENAPEPKPKQKSKIIDATKVINGGKKFEDDPPFAD